MWATLSCRVTLSHGATLSWRATLSHGATLSCRVTLSHGATLSWKATLNIMKGYTFIWGGYTFSWGDIFVWATLSRRDTLLYGRHFYTERHFRYLLLSVVIYSDVLSHFYMERHFHVALKFHGDPHLNKVFEHLHRIPQSHRALSGWLGSSFVSWSMRSCITGGIATRY